MAFRPRCPTHFREAGASLVLFDGWIDVDLVSSGSAWVDAVAGVHRGPVWQELNLELVTAEAALASIEGQEGGCG